jgi:Animal haem peroxidase
LKKKRGELIMVAAHHGESFLRGVREGGQRPSDFGRFGRLFPHLHPLVVDKDRLQALADTLRDDATTASLTSDNANVPAGYTYLGQFIDHDITLDITAVGAAENDPTAVTDFRTPRLDLDAVYGNGPTASPNLYDRVNQNKLAVGVCGPGGAGDKNIKDNKLHNDLMRNREGLAVIGDPRNDENLLVAQTHLAFVKFHNAVVDRLVAGGATSAADLFDEARRLVIRHYQWIVLHDFLARLVDFNDVQDVLTNGRKFFKFEATSAFHVPFMPVEFSAAAYRLGHTMVRERYSYNRAFNDTTPPPIDFSLLFTFTGLSGGIVGDLSNPATNAALAAQLKTLLPIITAKLPGDWAIDWHRFYELGEPKPVPPGSGGSQDNHFRLNLARSIDPYLAPVLHNLPGGGGSLPFRNMLRGVEFGLPSGQDVASAMGIRVLSAGEIAESGPDGAKARQLGFDVATPLWYYILKEAQLRGRGQRLDGVGSRILAEVFVGMLQADKESFLNQQPAWTPTLPASNPGNFTMPDLLRFVNDLDPVNEPATFA